MRQSYAGGDKRFVDYVGDTVAVIVDRLSGKIRPAQMFVAVLGASNFTYAEASWTQALGDWIGAHTRAFAAIGGVPRLLVPDNTKVAVIKACLYEPQVNRSYAEMAAPYDTAILPARPRRPRDKAKVEAAVLIIARWLLGRLRHRRFYSLAELNAAIGEVLRQLNEERPRRRLGVTRRALLEELDRPNLKRLAARLRYARLRQHAVVEDIDYRTPRGLDRALFQKLAGGEWIEAHDNLILCGPTGVGNSWLACALGHKACRDNRSVLYRRVPKLFGDLALARGDGRYARILKSLAGVQLLILDDWGLEPLDAGARHDLYEILEERYGRRSTILTSQVPVDKWHAVIGDPTYADAILDRLVHNAHRIDLAGDSLRRRRSLSAPRAAE
jgi:DNA replication protein DnaC